MTYAPGHEKELFDRSVGCRVGVYPASRPASKRARTTEDPHHPRDSRRHLLCPEEWLPLAALASGFSALGDRLLVVREMARGWNLRAAQRRATRAATGEVGQEEPAPECGRRRDSQSAKTTGVGGEQRGYDGNKKVRGRKRHLLWWTRRACSSKPRFTARRCQTRTG
jgi:hypothetical protein